MKQSKQNFRIVDWNGNQGTQGDVDPTLSPVEEHQSKLSLGPQQN